MTFLAQNMLNGGYFCPPSPPHCGLKFFCSVLGLKWFFGVYIGLKWSPDFGPLGLLLKKSSTTPIKEAKGQMWSWPLWTLISQLFCKLFEVCKSLKCSSGNWLLDYDPQKEPSGHSCPLRLQLRRHKDMQSLDRVWAISCSMSHKKYPKIYHSDQPGICELVKGK